MDEEIKGMVAMMTKDIRQHIIDHNEGIDPFGNPFASLRMELLIGAVAVEMAKMERRILQKSPSGPRQNLAFR